MKVLNEFTIYYMNTFKRYKADSLGSGNVGIKLPANSAGSSSNDSLFNMSSSTEEQSISNFINLLLTKPGERYMQPEFGIGLQLYLFEQNTTSLASTLTTIIETQANLWLPYIYIHRLSVTNDIPRIDQNSIGITITFSVTEYGANKQLTIFNVNGRPTFNIASEVNE